MRKYQIKEVKEIYNHAGSKAVEDVCRFAGELSYEPVYIRQRTKDTGIFTLIRNQAGFFWDWLSGLCKMEKNSILLLQNPIKRKQLGMFFLLRLFKKIKKLRVISVIHDVEELRLSLYRSYSAKEFNFMLHNSDCFIVHNKVMQEYFTKRGVVRDNIISLGIFDYALEKNKVENHETAGTRADVVIAGNMDSHKCPYVYRLFDLKNKFSVNLYGPDYKSDRASDYISYCGSFPAEEVPFVLNGSYGLVWDGDSLFECTGATGNYLRYNNPHKTSLYLVSHIPVIIWEKAALADFIRENGLGITVGSLEEIKEKIDLITPEEYNNMVSNVIRMSEKLKTGYHIKEALKRCEERALS